MAKKTTQANKKEATKGPKDIQVAYLDFVTQSSRRPNSARELCEETELDLEFFNQHFKNLVAVEKSLWLNWFEETLEVLESSEEYAQYSAQERLFAFLYTWLETMEPHVEYIKLAPRYFNVFRPDELVLSSFKKSYLAYTADLAELAKATGELLNRPVVEKIYPETFWLQLVFTLNYWLKDDSEDKAKTDEAIERSVSLAFEWMGRNPLDSIFEFGKFLLEKKDGRTKEDTDE